jgi:hypothetical protein
MENAKDITIDQPATEALKRHEGKWVALAGAEIVASGNNVTEVQRQAREQGHEEIVLYLVPSTAGSLAPHGV